MTPLLFLELMSYVVIYVYGTVLTISFTGGLKKKRDSIIALIFCLIDLIIQGLCYRAFRLTFTRQLYPFIAHIPGTILLLCLGKPLFQAVTSIFTCYLFCQLPNWFKTLLLYVTGETCLSYIMYIVLTFMLLALINYYIAPKVYAIFTFSKNSLYIFGLLPIIYYIFDYTVTVYSHNLEHYIPFINETLPFLIVVFYLLFCICFHNELEQRTIAEFDNARLQMDLLRYESFKEKMDEVQRARHDLRQHLRLISSYLENGDMQILKDYIERYGQSLPTDTGIRYCENNVADTVIRFYAEKSQEHNIEFVSKVALPEKLNINEPDLCVLLGNLLENAFNSCMAHLDDHPKIVINGQLIGSQALTITVDNSPADMPKRINTRFLSSERNAFGIGTSSIENVAGRYDGDCRFDWKDGSFFASIVLHLK